MMYEYDAVVTKVCSGDTIIVDVDLGLGVCIIGQKLKLSGIKAPKMKGKSKIKGLKARTYLRELILSKEVRIETGKGSKRKEGSYTCEVFKFKVFPPTSDSTGSGIESGGSKAGWVSIITVLVNAGHAVYKDH